MSSIDLELIVNEAQIGERFDKLLANVWSDYSRSKIQSWIESGEVLLNGKPMSPKQKSKLGDHCVLSASLDAVDQWLPEPMDLQCVYEDEQIIVLNKPANLVVHPAAGNWSGTLVNGLLHNYPELEALPRAGIVHRLDKDTTGVMVVARTLESHNSLVKAMQAREIRREYQALVFGELPQKEFTVDAPIGRHPKNRLKMAVVPGGKHAKTHFRLQRDFGGFRLLDVRLETGRTHQIRVHLAYAGVPIFGDQLYGQQQISNPHEFVLDRQALHAWRLRLKHPLTGQSMRFEAGLPKDLKTIIENLEVLDAGL